MIRGFEEQFKQSSVKRIQELLNRISVLRFSGRASHYYKVDLDICLRAGALLGALQITSSLLELVVREIEIHRISKQESYPDGTVINPQRELEKKRNLGFKAMINNLKGSDTLNADISKRAIEFYNSVRIPIHHGLVLRFVETYTDRSADELLGAIFGFDNIDIDRSVGMHEFEETIEDQSLELIEAGIALIEELAKIEMTGPVN